MVTAAPIVAGIGISYPPSMSQDTLWSGYFARHFGGPEKALARRIFASSGVAARHGAVNLTIEDVSGWSTDRRMRRYITEAMPLGKEAAGTALACAGVNAADIGLFVVCSCTGYATPGLDILLARDLGLDPSAQRLFVGHMGCYAALPALGVAGDFVIARQRPALLLCAELTSLHAQPPTADPQQIIAHALFSDAAAAVVLTPSQSRYGASTGYAVTDVISVTDTTTADQMTWDVTDLGFRMGLSPRVPDVLAAHVRDMVEKLLRRNGLTLSDVDSWAVHPGGPRILNVVERELELSTVDMIASRETLAAHGNCSSPTVLMIIDRLIRTESPRRTVALAFGPGLTLFGALLTQTV